MNLHKLKCEEINREELCAIKGGDQFSYDLGYLMGTVYTFIEKAPFPRLGWTLL
ncbi:hypothetical protein C900_05443 [Fulvivirga imtechensis AK7]|uniref:Uncharacterized protein n=1 Tax=Fulvivirga imtechensis AK7 TaxID=1237149 RepID=L8JNE2_9BACT|nr:hypothetical protein [Fulvivirga imtechensis]ELR69054.1 hypothetical protein C900_05443 [Fulvivirga imtechensis AK7]